MNSLIDYIFTVQSLAQALIVIISIAISFLLRYLFAKTLFKDGDGKKTMLGRGFESIAPIFGPLVSVVLISAGQAFFVKFVGQDMRIIELGYELVILWAVVKLISLSTESRPIIYFSLVAGLAIVGLSFTGNLSPFVDFLNRFSFKIGTYQFSIVALVKGIVALGILFWAAGVSTKMVRFLISRFSKLRVSNRELAAKSAQIAIYFVLFMVALDIMGIDLTALAVFGGAVGVGLGFGLQKITSNFISGLILLVEKTVEVGDVVELENGLYGHVRQIGARYTMLETLDTKEVMVPNEEFISTKVTNWTYSNPTGRMEINIGISYDTDLDMARDVMIDALKDHPRILRNPEPMCLLDEFADSSVNFRLLFWIDDVSYKYWRVKSDVMFAVWHVLKNNNIEIPYPQRDLNIRNVDADIMRSLEQQKTKTTNTKSTPSNRKKDDK